jgi:polar amino acid transport system permease protein
MIDYLLETTKYLSTGASVSLRIFFVTLALSFPISIILSMSYRLNPFFRRLTSFYTWLFRGTPLMLQLFFFMFGLPAFGIMVDRMMVAYIAFVLNYAAYFTEIMRAGIESLPKDQEESAQMMGASRFKTYRFVIMPQAIRKEMPTITNEVITLIKDTSLVTVIAISDLMRNVKEVVSRDFTISPFFLAAVFYLLMSFIIIKIFKRLEQKFDFMDNTVS